MVLARSGSKHLKFLLEKDMVKFTPSTLLQKAYTLAALETSLKEIQGEVQEDHKEESNEKARDKSSIEEEPERMILTNTSGKTIAEQLEVPALEVEIERAVWQVERDIKAREELAEEKKKMESSQKPRR